MSVLRGEGDTLILYGTTDVPVGARTLTAYLARPDLTGEWPTVLLVPSAWGLTPAVKAVCRTLARHGLAVVAPDPYRDEGPGRDAPASTATAAMAALPAARVRSDLAGVAEFVAGPTGFWSNAEDGFGLLGFGDGAVLAAASAGAMPGLRSLGLVGAPLRGTPELPVPGDLVEAVAGTGMATLAVFAAEDERFAADRLDAFRSAAPRATVVRYEGAGADFWDDYLDAYDDAVARDAFDRLEAFFSETLPPRR